jgi:hypothetical protein
MVYDICLKFGSSYISFRNPHDNSSRLIDVQAVGKMTLGIYKKKYSLVTVSDCDSH